MKRIYMIIGIVVAFFVTACQSVKEGYLMTENAGYTIDSLVIRKKPDPVQDATRIANKAPWVTLMMSGFAGTAQLEFTIESVYSTVGEDAAAVFKDELSILGGGAMYYPLENSAVPGRYTVSIRISNKDYSQVVEDCYTFIVRE